MGTSEDPRRSSAWRRYEVSIHKLLTALDPASDVWHDQHVIGRFSQASRQIDVWAKGRVAGVEITVAVECKRYARAVAVGDVDQFIGKLLDIGSDRGVLYSHSGFSGAAVSRAANARNPHVLAVTLETPETVVRSRAAATGYSADLAIQEMTPPRIEELDTEEFKWFLRNGEWSRL